MRLRPLLVCLGCLLVLRPCQADSSADPLRFLPAKADLLIKIEKPAAILQTLLANPLFGRFQQLDAVREAYDSTSARRFYQLIGYLERELGVERYALLEQLTCGGAAFAAKIEAEGSPVLFVIQGRDETLWRRSFKIFLEVAEQEMARKELKEKLAHGSYRRIDTVQIGNDFHAAVAGSALILSNKQHSLHSALDCFLDPKAPNLTTVAEVKQAHDLAGPAANAWMWFNLPLARNSPGGKEAFVLPRNDANLTVLFGGWLDVAQFAPFLCAGAFVDPMESRLSFRMPRDLAKSAPAMRLHIPPSGAAAVRPLLEPTGVLFSSSYYLDLAAIWESRAQLFNDAQNKALEAFDKSSGRFLTGSSFSKLVGLTGTNHRLVVAHQPTCAYKTIPQQNIPAFAYVVELRDPESFGKRMEVILRAAGILASTQVKLQTFEEECLGHKIVGYRISETAPLANDPTNLRFNFVPCFTRVGNQFIFCSTLSLCRELVELLERGNKSPANPNAGPASVLQFYSSGGAQLLDFYKDVILTQTILDSAAAPEKASKQVEELIQLVRGLGVLHIESRYSAKDFRYDVRFIPTASEISTGGAKKTK
jgi:hypothetical protein